MGFKGMRMREYSLELPARHLEWIWEYGLVRV